MGRACNMHWEIRNAYKVLVGKSGGRDYSEELGVMRGYLN
jgi:hypothetical protein